MDRGTPHAGCNETGLILIAVLVSVDDLRTAQEKAKEWWTRTKTAVGLQEEVEEEPANTSLLDQFSEATTLNKTQV